MTRTGLDHSLTKCAKMRTKNSVFTRFNFTKYDAGSKYRERASNLRSLSFATERMGVNPASWVSISKAGGGRGVAGGTKKFKNQVRPCRFFYFLCCFQYWDDYHVKTNFTFISQTFWDFWCWSATWRQRPFPLFWTWNYTAARLAQWDKRRSAEREVAGSNPGRTNTQSL